MKSQFLIIFFAATFALILKAQAVVLDFNLNLFQSSLIRTDAHQNSKTFGSFGAYANLGKGQTGRLYIGWGIISVSSTDDFSTTLNESFSSSDMGPAFRWGIDKNQIYSLSFVYGILSKGKYQTTLIDESLSGTSYFTKFSIEPPLWEKFSLGFAINYYSATYDKKVVGSTETSVSYGAAWLFPSISFVAKF